MKRRSRLNHCRRQIKRLELEISRAVVRGRGFDILGYPNISLVINPMIDLNRPDRCRWEDDGGSVA